MAKIGINTCQIKQLNTLEIVINSLSGRNFENAAAESPLIARHSKRKWSSRRRLPRDIQDKFTRGFGHVMSGGALLEPQRVLSVLVVLLI